MQAFAAGKNLSVYDQMYEEQGLQARKKQTLSIGVPD
jgi:hypothetical protein